jgi:CubicO group peptidase (beta-lactamase class C family)
MIFNTKSKILALLVTILFFSIPVSSTSYWPTDIWLESDPETEFMDPELIQAASDYLEENAPSLNTLIIRNGYIVMENSPLSSDSITDILSATKSFAATLIGIAIHEGFIEGLDQKMLDFFPDRTILNVDARKESIILEHMLTMTAGFDYNEHNCSYYSTENSFYKMTHSADMVQYMLDLPIVFEPGTHWEYSTGTSNLIGAIIEETTGMDLESFADQYLFDKIGIGSSFWDRAINGIFTGTGLSLSTRSLASLAYLYLNNGMWDGMELLSEEWVNAVLSSKIDDQGYSEQFNTDYGYSYQWWNMEEEGIYFAWGSDGVSLHTRIYIIPSVQIIAVFSGYATNEPSEYILDNYILPSITDGPEEQGTDLFVYVLITIPVVLILVYVLKNNTNR